jgi:hypothetical protein
MANAVAEVSSIQRSGRIRAMPATQQFTGMIGVPPVKLALVFLNPMFIRSLIP